MNHQVCNRATWLGFTFTIPPDSLSHFSLLNHWSRWWSKQEEMTLILLEQLQNRCPESSLQLCVHYKTTVPGGMQSWLQLLDDKVRHSRGWVVKLTFFFVVTVFDWQGNAQWTWMLGCVYELCACNDERHSLSYCSNAQSELFHTMQLIVCILDSD